ncbi:hypothetical protein HZS_52 [Henneguya salminicola]|nr:hypothetical protein HZS_52 [Henneguya salminicola]
MIKCGPGLPSKMIRLSSEKIKITRSHSELELGARERANIVCLMPTIIHLTLNSSVTFVDSLTNGCIYTIKGA